MGRLGPLNIRKAGLGLMSIHPSPPASEPGRSLLGFPWKVWGPREGSVGQKSSGWFSCGVQAVVGLWCSERCWGAGSFRESLVCSLPCRMGKAQAQPFVSLKNPNKSKYWKKSSLGRRLFYFILFCFLLFIFNMYFILFGGNPAAVLQVPVSLLSLLQFIAPPWIQTFEPGRAQC